MPETRKSSAQTELLPERGQARGRHLPKMGCAAYVSCHIWVSFVLWSKFGTEVRHEVRAYPQLEFYPRATALPSIARIAPMEGENGPPIGAARSCLLAGGSAEAAGMIHSSGASPCLKVSSLVYLTFRENCALCPCLRPSNHRPVARPKHTPLHAWHNHDISIACERTRIDDG